MVVRHKKTSSLLCLFRGRGQVLGQCLARALLGLVLTMSSLQLMASEVERKTRSSEAPPPWAKATLSQEIEKATHLPAAISDLIVQHVEEYGPYKKIKTLKNPQELERHLIIMGFSDDSTMFTLAGKMSNGSASLAVYNVADGNLINNFQQKETDPSIGSSLLLSGNGKILIHDKEIFDTLTGNHEEIVKRVQLLSKQDYRSADSARELIEVRKKLAGHNRRLVFLNYDGTKVISTHHDPYYPGIYLYDFKVQKGVSLEIDNDPSLDDHHYFYSEFRLSGDENVLVCSDGWRRRHRIKFFDANTGRGTANYDIPRLKPRNSVYEPWHFSFDLNYDGSQLFYSFYDRDEHSDVAILADLSAGTTKEIFKIERPSVSRYVNIFKPLGGVILKVGFSSIGNLYIVSRELFRKNQPKNLMRYYNLDKGTTEVIYFDHDVQAVAFNRDDTLLAAGSKNVTEIFERLTETEIAQQELEAKRQAAQEAGNVRDAHAIEQERLEQQKLDRERLASTWPAVIARHIVKTSTIPRRNAQQQKNVSPQDRQAYEARRGAIHQRLSASETVQRFRSGHLIPAVEGPD